MQIRWDKEGKDVREQHLEGACNDISKLRLEFFEINPQAPQGQPVRVHHVRQVSDGQMQIFLDTSKEG